MKNSEKVILIILGITIIGLLIVMYINIKKKSDEISELKSDQLRLQKFLFDKYGKSPSVIDKEIVNLINQYQNHPETIENLKRASELYSEGHIEEAVRKLVVIIENKIKFKLEIHGDSWFTTLSESKKRYAKINELLEKARELGWINDLQLSIAYTAVNIRHGESHKEGYKDEKTRAQICMLGSIEIIGEIVPQIALTESMLEAVIEN